MSTGIEIAVRGYHLDLYGHVNNARYLEFLEEARWALFFDQGDEWAFFERRGLAFVVVNININYRHPAMLGDLLRVDAKLARIGQRSAVVHQSVVEQHHDRAIVDADVTFVVIDRKSQRAEPLDGELRDRLERIAG
jgi:thioesterase-3